MLRLFRQLFDLFLFSGTMFLAAGATTLSGDGGASGATSGEAGGTSDVSDDSGAGAGDGSGDVSEDQNASGVDDGTGAGDKADQHADPDAPVDLGDGRTVPAKWKSLFDAAKTHGLEKEVRAMFFGGQRLTQAFPGGIKEALELAKTVEEYGGVEALGELRSDLDTYHADAELFQNDPGKWLETAFQENAEASLKAFAHSLDFVSEAHPDHYNHLMAKVIVNDLGGLKLDRIYSVLAGMKDSPEAKQLAQELADYYNYRLDLSKKVPERKADAERSKLDTEKQSLASERDQLRNHTVNSQTIPLLGRQMTTHVDRIAKEAGFDLKTLSAGSAKAMRTDILNKVMRKAASDKTFVKNYRAVMNEGNTQRAVKMMNDKHNAILPEIVRGVAKEYGIVKKAGARTASGGASGEKRTASAGSGGIARVNAKPDSKLIDWNKTGNDIYDSIATLKDGRRVTWA